MPASRTARNSTPPAIRYEQIKRKSFIGSSRLEGIELSETRSCQSLEEVVARYKNLSRG